MSEKIEFYKGAHADEDMERMRRIEYPNLVSEQLFDQFELSNKKVLDSGSGPNPGLAEYVARRDGTYIPLDLRTDALASMKEKLDTEQLPFLGVRGDVRALPFTDHTFDLVHQRFVFMNIAPETRQKALEELLRVGKNDFVFLEYDWRTLASAENPELIETFRRLAFEGFKKFNTDPFMGQKLEELVRQGGLDLQCDIREFRRPEETANTPELILNVRGMAAGAKQVLHDDALAGELEDLAKKLEEKPFAFEPPAIIAAIVKHSS